MHSEQFRKIKEFIMEGERDFVATFLVIQQPKTGQIVVS